MQNTTKLPFYAQAALISVGLFALMSMLYIGQSIMLPIIYATIFAIALNPLVNFFVRKKVNRVVAITITLVIVSLISLLLIVVLSSRLTTFIDSFPKLLDKFYVTFNRSISWLSTNFNINKTFISDTKTELLSGSSALIGKTFNTVGNTLAIFFLIPVYVFMILYYQPLLLDFIRQLFGLQNQKEVNEILISIKLIIQKYLTALLLEAGIIAALNSVGLLILGIDYAIVLGIIGAILNVIPYLGGMIALALSMIVAFATEESSIYPLLVALQYLIIQLIDNNFVLPKLVASKVRINALVSIIVVIAGGALWGIPGMFLSIPLTAILKVIFDHIEILKPWGFLLGDTMPIQPILLFRRKKKE